MRADILANIDNPHQLEKLYRENKTGFKQQFSLIYPELKQHQIADFWNERLNYEAEDIYWGSLKDIRFVIVASVVAGILAKLPGMLHLDAETFYLRNIGFIVLPLLSLYFAWKKRANTTTIVSVAAAVLASIVYINLVPKVEGSDSLLLACIHLPLFLWSLLGLAFVGGDLHDHTKRLAFLRYNGDLVVMVALIAIAGVILTGVTIGLFSLLDLKIEQFYIENVVIFGMAAAPIVATFLVETNPQIVGRVSPLIARIFSPLVLATLVAYLVAILVSGKSLYDDRDFLLTFNALLIGVMAIIFFSVAGTSNATKNYVEILVLFLLSILTIIVNGFALSAILFRITEWGITPNRIAVLGGNILILINLGLVAFQLFKALRSRKNTTQVGGMIAFFLPVYALWAFLVTFVLPALFSFR